MIAFDRLLFCYETCLNCALLPAKTCAACAGTGLVIRKIHPHPRPHPQSLQELLTIAGRRAGLAQAALRLQTWLAVQTAEPMPRGKNGSVH